MINNSTKGSVCNRKKVGMDDQKSCLLSRDNYKSSSSSKKKKTNIADGRNKGKKLQLLSFHQLPDYMKDNEYILDYYRADWPIKQALFSLFSWHNETLNVWTHLLGFLLFVGLTVSNLVDVPQVADLITIITEQFPSSAESNTSKNLSLGPTKLLDLKQESSLKTNIFSLETITTNWPFYVFLCGSMFCLLSSSVCHLFSCHSHRLNVHLLHIDYVGITVMIITSFFPPIYYIFQCNPHWQILYLTSITTMGICTIVALLSPALSSSKYRSLRAMLFVSMGLFGLIPAVHALVLNWHDPHRNLTLAYESGMALSYLVGTGFYVSRIPERWRPGWFDLAGHSHQIFHVLVVMGALAHYGAAQIFLRYRSGMACDIHTTA
ncbi:heptahelical transmembrane protein 1 [Phtheirospermum japonicum]|uniref:Heptahelical transmembrane protein 1 n=1 Tax=Phtheirospermum japonicum TaxID=374723 RepID=A0A830B924_9LAMI|nr:heptahelical transmembrane protein 1 [Phtheirospermum japonicum]